MLEGFLKDSKWQPQLIIIRKISLISRDVLIVVLRRSFLQIVDVIQLLTVLQIVLSQMFHKVLNMLLIMLNINSIYFRKNEVFQSLQISSNFNFNFILNLLPCAEKLLITISIYISSNSNWLTHADEYIWY